MGSPCAAAHTAVGTVPASPKRVPCRPPAEAAGGGGTPTGPRLCLFPLQPHDLRAQVSTRSAPTQPLPNTRASQPHVEKPARPHPPTYPPTGPWGSQGGSGSRGCVGPSMAQRRLLTVTPSCTGGETEAWGSSL